MTTNRPLQPPESGALFPGPANIHTDIYPAISPAKTPSLRQPSKVVLITGAGRGCGRAMALQYAHAGVACLILVSRTSTQLDEVEKEISSIDPEIRVRKFTVDVTSEEDVEKCADVVRKEEGRLDVLVNNAGKLEKPGAMAESEPGEWWSVMEVNIRGPYLFLHTFLPLLVETAEQNKRSVDVINVSSIGALVKIPGFSAYQTSKLAIWKMTEFVELEYGEKGVNAYAIHPGGVMTELAKDMEILTPYLNDTPELSGGFVVWLTAEQRSWLAGRYLSATWDVEKLENMKDEIVAEDKLRLKLVQ